MQLDFTISPSQLKALHAGAVAVREPAALFSIAGPGALACLQGLLTSDLAAPGEGSLVYGALLTPKGMILVDPWVLREAERFTLMIARHARETAAQLFARVLPPRLARVTDLSENWSAVWLLGPCALERFARANSCALPGAGRIVRVGPEAQSLLAGGPPSAPFSGLALGPTKELEAMVERLEHGGGPVGDDAVLAAARVLAGWPTLGREIDERTLPQEVRFDELSAVSYVKGCYTGQETVARVHFRGHVNRTLRGVKLEGAGPVADRTLRRDLKEVGEIKTALLLPDRAVALAVVRREVSDGEQLLAGDRPTSVLPLPFDPALVG
jgi:folate-binding protein YgfZ